MQVILPTLELLTRYSDKLIKHNGFEKIQQKYIDVSLDVLFFNIYMDEDKKDILEEKEDGENYYAHYNACRRRFQERD